MGNLAWFGKSLFGPDTWIFATIVGLLFVIMLVFVIRFFVIAKKVKKDSLGKKAKSSDT